MFLTDDEQLHKRQVKVFTINPKLIRKFKEAYVDLDKTDQIDALLRNDQIYTPGRKVNR
jgi:transposase